MDISFVDITAHRPDAVGLKKGRIIDTFAGTQAYNHLVSLQTAEMHVIDPESNPSISEHAAGMIGYIQEGERLT